MNKEQRQKLKELFSEKTGAEIACIMGYLVAISTRKQKKWD